MSISGPISLYIAVRALECLCAISLLIQTLEFLRLRSATSHTGVWSWGIQRADVAHAPAWLRRVFDVLYRDRLYHLHLLLRAGAAASLFLGSSPFSAVLLLASTIVILIRWRGAFNGGLRRTFAGGATGSGVFAYLEGFEGTESFLRAASNGSLGTGGYLFLFSLIALATVWIANIITVRRVVV